ncbi:hypothetical protein F4782DRAFT_339705 [Xylaria castorea]|nr:hypothetical protein F4782DRAFT_339705 [Xylaria castorea]
MSSSTGDLTAHASNDESKLSCEELSSLTAHEPASLVTVPAEIVINILGYLGAKKDWLCLAGTCQRVSNFVVAELDKYSVEDGDYYAVWYACVANKPAILLRHIALDATVVNRHFTRNFQRERLRRVKFRSKWRFYPQLRVFGKGMTPLAVAIVAGSEAIAQVLLVNGADPNRQDLRSISNSIPWHPIHWAVASKHESSVATIRMLGVHSANMNQVPEASMNGIFEYQKYIGCAPIFSLLMLQKPQWDSGGKRQTNCEEFNNDLRQLQGLRLRQLEALLQCGADPNVRNELDAVTPVFFLLSNLAIYNPSFYFEKSVTLSHEEDEQANVINEIATSFLDVLRDFGADICELGRSYFYHEILDSRIYVVSPETPLHTACRLKDRHKPIIDWFLRNGLSIDSLSRAQSTPLMVYCRSAFTDLDLFRKFLRNGPLINHSDTLGRTALHHLCANTKLRPQVMEKAVKMMLDRGADPTFMSNDGHVPAKELNPVKPNPGERNSREPDSPYTDVLAMLEMATKVWNKRARKREEQESKNNEGLALARSGSQGDRADNWRSDRERRVSHGNNGPENRKDGYGDKQTSHGTGSPVDGQTRNHATSKGSNRGSQRENRGKHQDSHQDNTHGGTQHSNNDNGNGRGKDRQDNSRRRHDKSTTQENDQPNPRGIFYQKARGGRYCSDNQGGHKGGNHGPTEKSIKSEPEQTPIVSLPWFRQRGGEAGDHNALP